MGRVASGGNLVVPTSREEGGIWLVEMGEGIREVIIECILCYFHSHLLKNKFRLVKIVKMKCMMDQI